MSGKLEPLRARVKRQAHSPGAIKRARAARTAGMANAILPHGFANDCVAPTPQDLI